jgi:hypothetical protein
LINILLSQSVALLPLRAAITVGFFALTFLNSSANAQAFKPYATTKVTQAQWSEYYDQVKLRHGPSVRELEQDKLQMFFNLETQVVYTFTKAGHPAHPAWVSRLLVASGDKYALSLNGFYAGSEVEYKKLYANIELNSNRLKAALSAPPVVKP